MYGVCDASQSAVKVLMNTKYGLNSNQGVSIPSAVDLQRIELPELLKRQAMYTQVAKDLSQSKTAQRCAQLYSANAQTVGR